ncbi:MAG: DNA polymerase III subunit delta [Nitrospirae bacterium]|nr:MAG: DNA polymerase III subunit delta [Nitrospirota bacterium]
MSIKQFQQELAKRMPAPVYLLYSEEYFLLHEAMVSIKQAFADAGDFGLDVFDAASSDDSRPIEEIVDVLNTLPFMSERRVALLFNAQKIKKKEITPIEKYLGNPSASTLFVIFFEGKAKDLNKLFEPAALDRTKSVPLTLYEKDLPAWVAAVAKKKGISFTGDAINYLIIHAGDDLGTLHSEIEKFASWGSDRPVDAADIRAVVYAGAEYDAFSLCKAIEKGDVREAFKIYEKLGKGVEDQMLLGAMNWQYSASGKQFKSAAPTDDKKLSKIYRLLHEADIAVKQSRSFVMDELIIKLSKLQKT